MYQKFAIGSSRGRDTTTAREMLMLATETKLLLILRASNVNISLMLQVRRARASIRGIRVRTLFKNGFVIDGTGAKRFKGDVLVEGERIVSVGAELEVDADVTVDCTGLTVAPGFIDAHSHNDFFYDYEDAEKYYEPFLRQGITTQVTGNCGFSPFGVAADSKYKDKVGGGLFHAVRPGSFAEFVERAQGKLFVNMAPLVGHGTTRISVSGYDPAPLTEAQIAEEMRLVDEAMQGGAFGGSFGFMYEPGIYSKREELIAFAKRIAAYDGILTVHPRACSKVALGYPLLSKPHIELALDEVADIMKESGVRTEYSHLIFVGKTSWKSMEPMLAKFRKLNEEGYSIAYDNYSFTYGASVITVVLPPWYMALPEGERKKPFNMFKLKLMTNITKLALGLDFCDFTVAYISDDPAHKKYEGKTVSECAKEEGLSDFDMYIKLVDLSRGQGRLYLGKYYNDEIIDRLMTDDLSVFMTDAWVEAAGTQNGAAYQGFPYFLVRAREHKIPLESVIHKMTGKTAERFRLKDRGVLREGAYADITVFDYEGVKVDPAVPDFTPVGIKHVYVNGVPAVRDGEYAAKRVGKLLLRK